MTGINDDAWLTHVAKGKLGVGGILAQRKIKFRLESAVLEYRSSVDKIKEIAQRIAGQLS